jgi:hypothetical protein
VIGWRTGPHGKDTKPSESLCFEFAWRFDPTIYPILRNKEKAVRNNPLLQCGKKAGLKLIMAGLAAMSGAVVLPTNAAAQDKKDEITFNLVPNPQFVDCLRSSSNEEPRATATVIRGNLNDTLILDLDGIKPGLAFDLFTVQRSSLLAKNTPDPDFATKFNKSFGLAWYQSDIEIPKRRDAGHVRIKTILLDQIFGFDADTNVALKPTNTFHVGFWFNNPQDAVACGFDPTKPTPFNGEHQAGPLAMISVPDPNTKLGPLCTDPTTSNGVTSCNP